MSFLDPILGWTLSFHPLISIFILSLIVTLIINIIYKFVTDQKEMKRLKNSIDRYRKEMKGARDNPTRLMKLNSEAMEVNLQYMKHSLKATLFTFIPIIFIFAWMNAHFTYAPLDAGQPLTLTAEFIPGFTGDASITSETLKGSTATIQSDKKGGAASFALTGSAGIHTATLNYKEFSYNATIYFGQSPKEQVFPGTGPVKQIKVDYPRVHPLGAFHLGSWYPGWLSIYILLSIALSIGTKKLLKIY